MRCFRSGMRRVMLSVLAAVAGGCGDGDGAMGPPAPPDPSGPITIQTVVSFFPRPVSGTFEVTVGSALLGCSRGTFVDTPLDPDASSVFKELTCTEGGTGSFTILFHPITTPGWNVVPGSGKAAYAGLRGEGTFSFASTGPDGGEETFIGTIRYDL